MVRRYHDRYKEEFDNPGMRQNEGHQYPDNKKIVETSKKKEEGDKLVLN